MIRKELKQQYKNGGITKPLFIDAMFEKNKDLFEYMKLIEDTDIASIEITKDAVVFTSKNDGIKISSTEPDKRTAPFEIMNFDEYESEDSALLFQLIKDGDIIFDIGANIGWYSISMSKCFPNSKIYSFEPLKKTYENLQRNVKLNEASSIYIHNFGFAEENKVLKFYSSPNTSVSNSAINITGEADAITVECEVRKMDDFIDENKLSVDFVKCDVEGAELFVYKGAMQTLEKNQPIVFTEMLRKWSAKFGYHPNDIINLFRELGYLCFCSEMSKLKKIEEVTEVTTATNFFFLHTLKHIDLIKKYAL